MPPYRARPRWNWTRLLHLYAARAHFAAGGQPTGDSTLPDRLALFHECRDTFLAIWRHGVARDCLGHHLVGLRLRRLDLLVETFLADLQRVARVLRQLVDQR